MKTHTTIGAEILAGSSSPLIQLAAEVALNHHERWDGTGYPSGLVADRHPAQRSGRHGGRRVRRAHQPPHLQARMDPARSGAVHRRRARGAVRAAHRRRVHRGVPASAPIHRAGCASAGLIRSRSARSRCKSHRQADDEPRCQVEPNVVRCVMGSPDSAETTQSPTNRASSSHVDVQRSGAQCMTERRHRAEDARGVQPRVAIGHQPHAAVPRGPVG